MAFDSLSTTVPTGTDKIAGKQVTEGFLEGVVVADAAGNPITPATEATLAVLAEKLSIVRTVLLNAVSTTGQGSAVAGTVNPPTFTAQVSGAGSVAAAVKIWARNVASGGWVCLGTMIMTGTTTATDFLPCQFRYMEYMAELTEIYGSGAVVTVAMGA